MQFHPEIAPRPCRHIHCLAAPEFANDFQVFAAKLAPLFKGIRGEHEIIRVPAGGNGDSYTAIGKVVHHRPFLRHTHRVMQWKHDTRAA